MTKMADQTKEQRLDWAKGELVHRMDDRGRHCWYLFVKGLGGRRVTAERAREKLATYGLTVEDFLAE